jgi:two-component system sensor kinase FixL
MTRDPVDRPASGRWAGLAVVALPVLVVLIALAGIAVVYQVKAILAPEDDPRWTIYQIGFEHQRLLLAVETDASPDDIALRGEIYLSRIFALRDSPALEPVRRNMSGDKLLELLQSAQKTEGLLSNVREPSAKGALLTQLRGDARSVRELMIDIANVDARRREVEQQRRADYLVALGLLITLLLLALLSVAFSLRRSVARLTMAERDCAASRAVRTSILNALDDAVIGVAADGHVVFSNRRAVSLFGQAAVEGADAATLAEADGIGGALRALLAVPEQQYPHGLPATQQVEIHSVEGSRHFILRGFGCSDESGRPDRLRTLVTIADVTVEERTVRQARAYDERLSEMSRLLAYAAVSGGIVHELTQPLAAIRNYAYALKVSLKLRHAGEEPLAIAGHLSEEVDRAIEVVRNVRRLGPQDWDETGVCDLQEAVSQSIRLIAMGGDAPPVSVSGAQASVWVNGSLPLIGQVLVNLLRNALTASSKAGRPGAEVTITVRDDMADIEIADFGSGIDAEVASTLFTPFARSAQGGMGLGLAICQRIAMTVGGALSWINRPTGGAAFTFTVPLAKEGTLP